MLDSRKPASTEIWAELGQYILSRITCEGHGDGVVCLCSSDNNRMPQESHPWKNGRKLRPGMAPYL